MTFAIRWLRIVYGVACRLGAKNYLLLPLSVPRGANWNILLLRTRIKCAVICKTKNIGWHRNVEKYIGFQMCGHGNHAKHSVFTYDFDINPVFNDKANHNEHCILQSKRWTMLSE